MTVSEEERIIQSILDSPSDPGPMGVYADWLQDNGQYDLGVVLTGWTISLLRIVGGDYGGDSNGDGGYSGGDYSDRIRKLIQFTEKIMTDGWYILSKPSGYYPYVCVGEWKVVGFFAFLIKGKIIRRFGENGELAKLADDGPLPSTKLISAKSGEEYFYPICRVIPAKKEAWEPHL